MPRRSVIALTAIALLAAAPAQGETSDDRQFVTLPFSASRDQDAAAALQEAGKLFAADLCALVFDRYPKRCIRASIDWNDVIEINVLSSEGSRTRFSAMIDVARWGKRIGIPSMPDLAPLISPAGARPLWLDPTDDVTVTAHPDAFRVGEVFGRFRVAMVVPFGAGDDPAQSKLAAMRKIAEENKPDEPPPEQRFVREFVPEAPRTRTREPVREHGRNPWDEKMSGMRW